MNQNNPNVSSSSRIINRRDMLRDCSIGFGMTALMEMLSREARGAVSRIPQFPARAKHVIFCFMSGGVSHVDSFDPKPRLQRDHGKPMPLPIERTQFNQNGNIMASPFKFRRYGQSGIPVSDMFPHIGSCIDDVAVVRSMTSSFNEHAQSNFFMHSGMPFLGYPSAGAWTSYGLGSEAQNLPSFVVLRSGGSVVPHGGVGLYSNGFLPAVHQASLVDIDAREPVRDIVPSQPLAAQRDRMDFVRSMDKQFASRLSGSASVEAAIENYEMAYRMQRAIPELTDLAGESEATRQLYGISEDVPVRAAYGRQCLLARRLVERGVRFIELTCLTHNIGAGGAPNPWDQHLDLQKGHAKMAEQVDLPIAGLIRDLKQRGLLDQTLIVWAGEFGRTPFSQANSGRDHNPYAFSIFMAGGGIRGGTIYGETDEFGYHVTKDKCTVYDLWATVMHQLGVNHKDLTYRWGGRDFRLTDVHGQVISELI